MELEELKAKRDEMHAQMQIAERNEAELRSKVKEITDELQEVKQKLEAAEPFFWKTWLERRNFFKKINNTQSQLKAKSDALAGLEGKVAGLNKEIALLKNQLEKQSNEKAQMKEDELTDDEDLTTRLKEKRAAKHAIKVMETKVDFAISELVKRELELEKAKAEELCRKPKPLTPRMKKHRYFRSALSGA